MKRPHKLHPLTITIKTDEEKIRIKAWDESKQFKTTQEALFYIECLMAFHDLALNREIFGNERHATA
jgi:hypothetical protein